MGDFVILSLVIYNSLNEKASVPLMTCVWILVWDEQDEISVHANMVSQLSEKIPSNLIRAGVSIHIYMLSPSL